MTPETTQMLYDRAAQCERLAASAKLPEVRENLLDAASCWRALAFEDEELLALRRRRAVSRYAVMHTSPPGQHGAVVNLAGWI